MDKFFDVTCPYCSGTGRTLTSTCPVCDGGTIRFSGDRSEYVKCGTCRGTGRFNPIKPCPTCKGTGLVKPKVR